MNKCSITQQALKYTYINNYMYKQDVLSKEIDSLNRYTKDILSSSLSIKLKDVISKKLSDLDSRLEKEFSIYKTGKNYLKDLSDSETFLELKHYLNDFKDQEEWEDKHNLMTLYSKYTQERNKIDDTYVGDLDYKLKDKFTKEEIKSLDDMYAKSGIFSIIGTKYYDFLSTKEPKDIISEISNDTNIQSLGKIYGKFYITGILDTNLINLYNKGMSKDNIEKVKQIATIYAISQIKNYKDILNKLDSNPKIKDELMIASKSLNEIHNKLFNTTDDHIYSSMNHILDVYKDNYEKKAITLEEFKTLNTEEWEVLREPTKTTLGIKYRKVNIDKVEGIGTNTHYRHNNIIVDNSIYEKYSSDSNIYNMQIGKVDKPLKTLILTNEEKRKLGLIENPAHTLYRTLSRYKFMLESDQIRKDLTKNKVYNVTLSNINNLTKMIENNKHPWFLKFDDIEFNKLPKDIQRKYKKITNKSNINDFSSKIDYVRKDISPWLMGYNKTKIGNNEFLNKGLKILQKVVLLRKIKEVVVSPSKLFLDYISNNLILLTKGVPLQSIMPETKKANKALLELEQIQANLVLANINLLSDPSNVHYKNVVDKYNNQMKKHPYNFVYYNGFQQSLSTDVILKDFDSISGLHKDIKNIISKFVNKSDSEELNAFGSIIKRVISARGSGIDKLIYKLADIGEEGIIKNNIKQIAKDMEKIRNDKDVIQYLTNYTFSPGSAYTKIGTAFLQWSDTVPRIILYKYLRGEGIADKEAIKDVMDKFIDYRPNMPKTLQFASDTYLMPYPAFMVKVQRTLYDLFKEKPANSSIQFLMSLTNSNFFGIPESQVSIFGSNIIEKIIKDKVFSTPNDVEISPIQNIFDII